MIKLSRRQLLAASAPIAVAAAGIGAAPVDAASNEPAQPASTGGYGPPQPFDFNRLKQKAASLAHNGYAPTKPPAADIVGSIDFDVAQKIQFKPDRAIWRDGPGQFPVRLFHLDKFNPLPVRINVLDGQTAREVVYSPQDFDYGSTGLESKLPANLGFSGFRVMNGQNVATDWLAFQGASYFRSAGQDNQYGASARGIAVDTALSVKEEFPRFVEFWLAEPQPDLPAITIYALLDGPSLTGAYRFVAKKATGATMDVTASLFIRNDIARLGIAPMTSMYWYGENERRYATDWRPQIHDSDGLALWTGAGERIWRPLIDPPSLLTNTFMDKSPKGFGLMQRDRKFADYQDDSAFYNRRPSIWVEPQGAWDAGSVQLVEIPTQDEIHDNIVAFWNPQRAIKAKDQLDLNYRLYWQDQCPFPPKDVGCVTATRTGRGGVPGQPSPDDKNKRKFVIDFAGGPLTQMAPRFDVTPVVTVSRGKVTDAYVIKVVGTEKWRALFDVDAPGLDPVELRCFLRLDGKTLTETWLYHYIPLPEQCPP
jgi:glucans biosynthesis protein